MKILKAIVASATETLDHRQGIGLVCCSKGFPESIRREADFGYPPDAGGKAIYTLRLSEGLDPSWVIMNRTQPEADYTYRGTHISHTIAIRQNELMDFLRSADTGINSVFEFMRDFPWVSSWVGVPQWVEDADDMDASSEKNRFWAQDPDFGKPLAPQGLLAFDYPEDAPPRAKRAAWRFGDGSPEEILETFHRAWLSLDPWRGLRKYGDHLDEPHISLCESWICAFTTSHRDGSPTDPYQWIALSAARSSIPNRDVIDPAEWNAMSPDAVKERIGSELGSLLADRCVQGSEGWANTRLVDKLKNLEKNYEEKARIRAKDAHDDMLSLIETLRSKVDSSRQEILTFERERYWCYDDKAEAEVSELRGKLSGQQLKSLHETKTERSEYEAEVRKILELLPPGLAQESGFEITANDGFPSLTAEFEKLAECYRDDCRIIQSCQGYKQYHIAHDEISNQVIILKTQANNYNNDIRNKDRKISDLERIKSALETPKSSLVSAGKQKIKHNANNSQKIGWQVPALAGASLLIILATSWYIISRADNKPEKDTNSNSNQKSLIENQKLLIENQKSTIEQLDNKIKDLKLKNDSLSNENKNLKTVQSFDKTKKTPGNPGKSDDVNGRNDRNTGSQPSPPAVEAKPNGNPAPKSEGEPNEVDPLQTPEKEGGQKAKEGNAPSVSTEVSPVLEQPKRTEEKAAVDDKSKEGSDGN